MVEVVRGREATLDETALRGVDERDVRFDASANEIIVVATAEPTSITDAYALMKLLSIKYHIREFGLVANSVQSDAEGVGVFNRLNAACRQFLQVNLNFLGSVPFDTAIRKAVRQQRAILDLYPNSPSAKSIARLAVVVDEQPAAVQPSPPRSGPAGQSGSANGGAAAPPQSFWDRLLHWKKAK